MTNRKNYVIVRLVKKGLFPKSIVSMELRLFIITLSLIILPRASFATMGAGVTSALSAATARTRTMSSVIPALVPMTNCTGLQFPSAPNGGLTYVNRNFGIHDINDLQFVVEIDNNTLPSSDLFIQLYDSNIDHSEQYFGIQTTGTVLFSRFGSSSSADVSAPSGSTVVSDGDPNNGEGATYVSLRRDFGSLPMGAYYVRMSRGSFDGTGDWFQYFITFPGGTEQYIGAIRFPRAVANVPASFQDGGGTWTEAWDNNDSVLTSVNLLHVRTWAVANHQTLPVSATSSYSAMPNSDTFAESVDGFVDNTIGNCTQRTHSPGNLW